MTPSDAQEFYAKITQANVECSKALHNQAKHWALINRANRLNRAKHLPEELRRLRTRLGYSVQQLAAAIGVRELTIERWERGQSQPSPMARKAIDLLLASIWKNSMNKKDARMMEEGMKFARLLPQYVRSNDPNDTSAFAGSAASSIMVIAFNLMRKACGLEAAREWLVWTLTDTARTIESMSANEGGEMLRVSIQVLVADK